MTELKQHPRSVITGVSVLYISLLLTFISGIINIIHVTHGMPNLNITTTPPYFSAKEMLGIILAITIIDWYLILHINAGKSWSRIIYLILLIAGFVLWTVYFDRTIAQGIFALIGSVLNTLLGVIGIACLFTPSANDWFKHGCRNGNCK